MRMVGKISSWNEEKGFGFVMPNDGSKALFLYGKEFNWRPEVGQEISFVTGQDSKKRYCATDAVLNDAFLEKVK